MRDNLLMYIIYGFLTGFSEYTPLSASAHQALFQMLLDFDSNLPLLRFFVHVGAVGALVCMYWQRVSHIYRETKIFSVSPKLRKRPPDMNAVMEARFLLMAFPAAFIGAICSIFVGKIETNLFMLAIILIGGAALIYLPDYIPGGNRTIKMMLPLEGILFGLCAGVSIIPGVSAVGLILAVGQLRKCDRSYILDVALLISGLLLLTMVVADFLSVLIGGFAWFSIRVVFGCLLAAAASFGGGISAILMMRFLAVKTGFSAFAFYGWALGLFSFILYLMV